MPVAGGINLGDLGTSAYRRLPSSVHTLLRYPLNIMIAGACDQAW